MLSDYIPVLIFFIINIGLGVLLVILSHLFGPKTKEENRGSLLNPYECGIRSTGLEHKRYPIKFYLIAVLFVLFDLEIVFLWPWAISFGLFSEAGSAIFWFVEMLIFIIILVVGYIYILAKGVFEWD